MHLIIVIRLLACFHSDAFIIFVLEIRYINQTNLLSTLIKNKKLKMPPIESANPSTINGPFSERILNGITCCNGPGLLSKQHSCLLFRVKCRSGIRLSRINLSFRQLNVGHWMTSGYLVPLSRSCIHLNVRHFFVTYWTHFNAKSAHLRYIYTHTGAALFWVCAFESLLPGQKADDAADLRECVLRQDQAHGSM